MKHIIVWLDINSTDPKSSLRQKLGEEARICTDADVCVRYIQEHSHQLIYLIVSGSLARKVVPNIYHLTHVMRILVFCGWISNHSQWAIDFIEKVLIFDHEDNLLECLWKELESDIRQYANRLLKYADTINQRAIKYR
jgi:hypothetical protein